MGTALVVVGERRPIPETTLTTHASAFSPEESFDTGAKTEQNGTVESSRPHLQWRRLRRIAVPKQ